MNSDYELIRYYLFRSGVFLFMSLLLSGCVAIDQERSTVGQMDRAILRCDIIDFDISNRTARVASFLTNPTDGSLALPESVTTSGRSLSDFFQMYVTLNGSPIRSSVTMDEYWPYSYSSGGSAFDKTESSILNPYKSLKVNDAVVCVPSNGVYRIWGSLFFPSTNLNARGVHWGGCPGKMLYSTTNVLAIGSDCGSMWVIQKAPIEKR